MTKKITALVIVLFLVTLGTVACGTSEDKDILQSNQTNTRENIENKKASRERCPRDGGQEYYRPKWQAGARSRFEGLPWPGFVRRGISRSFY